MNIKEVLRKIEIKDGRCKLEMTIDELIELIGGELMAKDEEGNFAGNLIQMILKGVVGRIGL